MLRDSIIAAVRTGIAALIGLLIAWLVGLGVDVGDLEATLNVAMFGLFTALYNVVVSLLERNVHPMFGVLLGIPKAPAYGSVGTTTPEAKSTAAVDWALTVAQPESKVPAELKNPVPPVA